MDKKIFSFFSGSGFLDLGFEKAGFTISFVNEYRKSFMDAYHYARQNMGIGTPEYGFYNVDVNEFFGDWKATLSSFMADSEGSLTGFIGGPPCPDFSVAGKNKGKDGKNGQLSLSYVQLISCMQPDFFLFENVKGLWKTARHREYFEELKAMLHKAGYETTEKLVNALDYGCPQDRDRILLFGIKKNLLPGNSGIETFPWDKYRKYRSEDIKKLPWPGTEPFREGAETVCPAGIPEELTVEYWFRKNHVTLHPNAGDYFTPRAGLAKMLSVEEGDVSKKSYKRLHRWRYSPTVAYGNNEVHLHPYHARRLSAAEAMALQSLPEEFILPEGMPLTDKFKTIGNGVPFLLAYGIARTMDDFLDSM